MDKGNRWSQAPWAASVLVPIGTSLGHAGYCVCPAFGTTCACVCVPAHTPEKGVGHLGSSHLGGGWVRSSSEASGLCSSLIHCKVLYYVQLCRGGLGGPLRGCALWSAAGKREFWLPLLLPKAKHIQYQHYPTLNQVTPAGAAAMRTRKPPFMNEWLT